MLHKILNLQEEVASACIEKYCKENVTTVSQLELAKSINYALASIGYCSITQNTCSYISFIYK